METVKFAAVRLGIVSTEEAKNSEVVMDSEEFKEQIGSYVKKWDEAAQEFMIKFSDRSKANKVTR